MLGIVYVSQARVVFDHAALDELAVLSTCRNAEHGITGYLFFENGEFVQYIEGAPDTVKRLMARIELDSRHEVLAADYDENLAARRFPDWSMQRIFPEQLVHFGVENALADALLSLKTDREGLRESIWHWVDRIAQLQESIASGN